MRYYIVAVLAIAGGWHLYQKNLGNKDMIANAVQYAEKNKGSQWAPGIHYYAGLIYEKRDKPAEAEKVFLKLLSNYTTSHYVKKGLIRLSRVAKENRNWSVQQAALRMYIEEYPNGGDIGMAKAALDESQYKVGEISSYDLKMPPEEEEEQQR